MIPKVIHYCWFGGKPLPNDVKTCIKSWRKCCPDYEIKEWNESNFDVSSHPFLKSAYEAKAWAFVSDYARLQVVFNNGGIYFDTDVELLKNLDFLLDNKSFFGIQQAGHFCNSGLGFGAEKANPMLAHMLSQYDGLVYKEEIKYQIACPYLNSKALTEKGYIYQNRPVRLDDALVLSPRYMDPLAPGKTENLLCDDTISIHHYSASWTSKSNRIKRKILRTIGYDKLKKVRNTKP